MKIRAHAKAPYGLQYPYYPSNTPFRLTKEWQELDVTEAQLAILRADSGAVELDEGKPAAKPLNDNPPENIIPGIALARAAQEADAQKAEAALEAATAPAPKAEKASDKPADKPAKK